MNKIDISRSITELREEGIALQKRLVAIDNQLRKEEKGCEHIPINLGNKDTGNNTCRCLICGKAGNEDSFESKYLVHAENYLTSFDISNERDCDAKFEILQTTAWGIMKQNNPNMDNSELVTIFNTLIEESIQSEKESNDCEKRQYVKK